MSSPHGGSVWKNSGEDHVQTARNPDMHLHRSIWRASFVLIVTVIPAAGAERIAVVAGGDGRDGNPTHTKLDQPFGIAFDPLGNMFIVELTGHRVLKVDPRGNLTTVAGTGQKGDGGDGGPARK